MVVSPRQVENPQPDEHDRALFEYVLARSRARESSILAMVAIASSASMVLLGLYLQEAVKHTAQVVLYSPWIHLIGIAFAVLGIVYREVTNHYIHSNDEDWLNAYVKALGDGRISQTIINRCIQNPLCYSSGRYLRQFILRSLFVLPIIAWGFFLYAPQPSVGLAIAVICVLYPIGILTCDIKEKHD